MIPTQITKKKKKFTISKGKGAKQQPTPDGAAEGAEPTPAPAPDAQPEGDAPVEAVVKPPSYLWAAILAIVAFLLFATLITLQAMELNFFYKPPRVFPMPTAPLAARPTAIAELDEEPEPETDFEEAKDDVEFE